MLYVRSFIKSYYEEKILCVDGLAEIYLTNELTEPENEMPINSQQIFPFRITVSIILVP